MMTAFNQHSEKTLGELLQGLCELHEHENVVVHGLSLDSRSIKKGDAFLALAGGKQHGATFIADAIKAGASAILIEADHEIDLPKIDIPLLSVDSLRIKAGEIAHRFYDKPSARLPVIGITGTNGKTSTAWFIAQALSAMGNRVAYIGTIGIGLIEDLQQASNTTPDAISVHKALFEFEQTADYVVMEVSSHALSQHRISAVEFQSVVFTNLSRDHLDYHPSMEEYGNSKRRLFEDYKTGNRIINADDEYGLSILNSAKNHEGLFAYSLSETVQIDSAALVYARHETDKQGFISLSVSSPAGYDFVETRLIGEFNAYNLLASLAALSAAGFDFQKICQSLSSVSAVPGRMELITAENSPRVIVDYAHTPDALEKALKSLEASCKGKLICVFGCGGDRDKGKRSEMGKAASSHADMIILTNDNPRHENAKSIVEDIKQGIAEIGKVEICLDRQEAIELALNSADINDVVLIAGKGHEQTQQIADEYLPFSDRKCVQALLGVTT